MPDDTTPVSSILAQHVSELFQTKQVTTVDFYRNEFDQRIYLALLVPVLDTNDANRVIGALAMRIDPERYLYPFISNWPTNSQTAETLLIRRGGNDALFLNELKFQENTALTLRIPLGSKDVPAVKAALGQVGIVEGVDYRGVPVLADVRAVPDTPWFLVARMDTAEVYAPMRARLWEMIAFFGALLFRAGVVLIWRQQRMRFYRQRYLAAEALRESEVRYRLLFQNLTAGFALHVIILDDEGAPCDYRFLEINPAFEALTGLKAQNIIGKTVLQVLPDTETDWINRYGKVALTGEPIHFESFSRVLGKHYEVSAYATRPGRFATLFLDITERKQAEQEILKLNVELEQRIGERTAQLEASNKELEAFAYSVAHDLRSPLRGIDGFPRVILEDYADKLDAEGKRVLNIIRLNALKMDHLITELLALTRVTRSEMQFSPLDMTTLANSVYQEFASAEVQQGFSFSVAPLPQAYGDLTLMQQVWSNLLSNAIKYTLPKSVRNIEVGAYTEPSMNVYYVKDNGVGFDPEYAHKLYGVFQRLHKAEEFEGKGVGLAIVQRIVARHGGHVWAEGKINQGATGYFSLPKKEVNDGQPG
jgi:PAS domain S-box-containing protein